MDPSPGWPAAHIAPACVECIEGNCNGEVIDAREFAGSRSHGAT
jgi:hypothetical protein